MNIQTHIWTSDCAMCTVNVRNVCDPKCAMWCNPQGQDAQRAQPMCAINLPFAQQKQIMFKAIYFPKYDLKNEHVKVRSDMLTGVLCSRLCMFIRIPQLGICAFIRTPVCSLFNPCARTCAFHFQTRLRTARLLPVRLVGKFLTFFLRPHEPT